MSRLKIFITGGSGLLGQYLNLELSKSFNILTSYNHNIGNCKNFNSIKIDVSEFDLLENIFREFKPDVVVHTAAISSPQLVANHNPTDVFRINVLSTERIAQLCEKFKSRLIYTSTDLVYAGDRGKMLKEDAKLIPISLYAETKLMGEIKIQQTFENYIILRTALLYGFGLNRTKSHFQQLYYDLRAGKKVKLFTDQFRTPLELQDAAQIISRLCEHEIKNEIINFGGKERVSRFELGQYLCNVAGFDEMLLTPIKMEDIENFPAVEDVSMDISKLNSFGIFPKAIHESIRLSLQNIKL